MYPRNITTPLPYRTHRGHELDLVLESPDGRLVGIEVKARTTLRERDFRGLRHLAETEPDRFHRGAILHPGLEPVGFGERLHAAPTALEFFGDDDSTRGDPWQKGERLAGLVAAPGTLLVLDGLEPLTAALGDAN